MKDEIYSVTISGIRPLILHNGRLSDPMDPAVTRLKGLAKKQDKGDEDQEAVSRAEWEGGLYWDAKLGPYVPVDNLQALVEAGAKKRKLGTVFKSMVGIDFPDGADGVAIEYKGPRDIEGLWAAGGDARTFVFRKTARVKSSRIIRTRARFHDWRVKFRVEVLQNAVTGEQLKQAIRDAGVLVGLGDWRPRYGRFEVTEFKKA